jgi:hypothetical protein
MELVKVGGRDSPWNSHIFFKWPSIDNEIDMPGLLHKMCVNLIEPLALTHVHADGTRYTTNDLRYLHTLLTSLLSGV